MLQKDMGVEVWRGGGVEGWRGGGATRNMRLYRPTPFCDEQQYKRLFEHSSSHQGNLNKEINVTIKFSKVTRFPLGMSGD